MPIYEFKCSACDKIFEEFFRTKDDASRLQCPTCQSTEVKKLYSAFRVNTRQQVKGDYKPDKACEDFSCMPRKPSVFDEPEHSHSEYNDSMADEDFDDFE